MAKDLSFTAAHELIPYPFGLLSVASVSEYTAAQSNWARYTAHEFNSDAFALRLLTIGDDTVANGELHDATIEGDYAKRFLEYTPFGIEVEDYASALGIVSQDRFERVTKIMQASTSKAVERELWEGNAAKEGTGYTAYVVSGAVVASNFATVTTTSAHGFAVGDIVTLFNLTSASGKVLYVVTSVPSSTTFIIAYTATNGALVLGTSPTASKSNNYLTKAHASTVVSVTAGGDTPRLALARLEGALAACPSGLKGAIHMSRKMALLMYDYLERADYNAKLDRDDVTEQGYGSGQILVTKLGTPVIVGTGYTGTGPDDNANAATSATTEWIYATGYVDVHLGHIDVVNEDLARSFTVSPNTNDARIKALRTAAVHFEPCCHYAARVDYSASV
jgi:hypothetical protein